MLKLLDRLEKPLIFLYFILLPSQTSYHFWLNSSQLFGRRIDYISPTLYLTQILMVLLLIYWLYKGYLSDIQITIPKFITGLIVFLIITNITLAQSPVISLYRYASLFLFFIFYNFLNRRYRLNSRLVILPLILSLVWTCLLAWLQWINQSSFGGPFLWLGERPLLFFIPDIAKVSFGNFGLTLRSYATFPHPNALAGYLLLTGLFIILNLKNQTRQFSYFFRTAIFITFFTLAITFSRSSAWALLSLPLVFIWLKRKHLSLRKFTYFLVSILLLFLTIYIPGNPSSFTERISQYQLSFSVFFTHPLFGVGLGNYLYYMPASLLKLTHNTWLLLLVELGLPLFSLIVYRILKILLRTLSLSAGLVILYWPLLITTFTDTYWLTLHQTTALVIFLWVYINQIAGNPKNITS